MRIVQTTAALPELVDGPRPILEWDLVEREIGRKTRSIAAHNLALHHIPKTLLTRRGIQIDAPVLPPWRGRRGLRCSASTASATRAASASLTAATAPRSGARFLCHQGSRQQKGDDSREHEDL